MQPIRAELEPRPQIPLSDVPNTPNTENLLQKSFNDSARTCKKKKKCRWKKNLLKSTAQSSEGNDIKV